MSAAVLAAAPLAVVLAVPAAAAPGVAAPGVAVARAPEGCGVVVTITGLGAGAHTAVVRATVLSSGDPVPVVPPATTSDTASDTTLAAGPDTTPATTPASDAPAAPSEPATASPGPSAPAPVLSAERTVTGDGEIVVVLDAAAVPDADPRVSVAVTVDGDAVPAVELALPGCGVLPTGEPTPTTPPTTPPASPPTTPPAAPETLPPAQQPAPTLPTAEVPAEPTPSPSTSGPTADPASPSPVLPTPSSTPAPPTASPSASPRPSASPQPSTGSPVRPSTPSVQSPVLLDVRAPSPPPSLDVVLDQAYGAVELGTGTSGSLSLMSFAAAPQLDIAGAPEAVPAPVIAAPEGSAAGVVAAPEGSGTRLEDLLPAAPDTSNDEPVAQLAAPELATRTAADPLVDLAPAAFVLSASLGGLLVAGRRRTS